MTGPYDNYYNQEPAQDAEGSDLVLTTRLGWLLAICLVAMVVFAAAVGAVVIGSIYLLEQIF